MGARPASTRPGSDLPTSPYTALFVVVDGLDRSPQVRQGITDVGYSTSAPESLIESVQRYLRVVEIVLSGIGVIALAIAALGITNAMLASVRERRREIGVLKAIGAADRDVRRIFLVEAGALGFLGGVVGTIVGYFTAEVLAAVVNRFLESQQLATVSLGLPVSVVIAVVAGATVLALVAGTIPAQRGSSAPRPTSDGGPVKAVARAIAVTIGWVLDRDRVLEREQRQQQRAGGERGNRADAARRRHRQRPRRHPRRSVARRLAAWSCTSMRSRARTVFVNAAERDATVASVLSRQVPIAEELMPETVLVWVGVNDMDRGVSATMFEPGMTDLLRALHDDVDHPLSSSPTSPRVTATTRPSAPPTTPRSRPRPRPLAPSSYRSATRPSRR